MLDDTATVQQLAREQQRLEALGAASIRALTAERDLHFRGRRLHRGRKALPLFAPHLHPKVGEDDEASFRGAADGLALRLRLSDARLHAALMPPGHVERLLFDVLEQMRVESLASSAMPGIAHNLRHRFEHWALAFHRSRLTETASGLLLYTVTQICRARVTNDPVLPATEDMMEATRAALSPVIGHALVGLRRTRSDQADYAQHALAIAHLVADMLRTGDEEQSRDSSATENEDDERAAFSLLMDLDASIDNNIADAVSGNSRVLTEASGRYRVFTTAYDQEVQAATLARQSLQAQYRAQLDARIAQSGINLTRLARDIKTLLAAPQEDGWNSGEEQGRIDGRRLGQLIASPTERRLFRSERCEPQADCAISFLVDCSGSMRQHIEAVAALLDSFARASEMAGVHCEVLGHTTAAWNGGRALRDWQRAGRPADPGRLNEALRLVFKAADTPWRRARAGMATLLKGDMFREGIDGEALLWAAARLRAREEPRKLLVVISDGCPMDGATALANDSHYLDQHLRNAVQALADEGLVRVHGLGVGLDLSPFYRRALAVDVAQTAGMALCRDLLGLLAGNPRITA